METLLKNLWIINIITGLITALIVCYVSYQKGKIEGIREEKRKKEGKHLVEYSHYPISSKTDGTVELHYGILMEYVYRCV